MIVKNIEKKLRKHEYSGKSFYALILIVGGLIGAVAAWYWQYTDRVPCLSIRCVQNDVLIAELKSQLLFSNKFQATNLCLKLDENLAPQIVSQSLKFLIASIEDETIKHLKDQITVPFTQRDSVIRTITDSMNQTKAKLSEIEPTIDFTLDIANTGARTSLWRAQCVYTYKLHSANKSLTVEIPLNGDIDLVSGSRKIIPCKIHFSLDNMLDWDSIVTDAFCNLFDKSDIARTNFVPFLNHIAQSRDCDLFQTMATAPTFATTQVFRPFVEQIKNNMLTAISNAQIQCTITIEDIHRNSYVIMAPLNVELLEGVKNPDSWGQVATDSILACREMNTHATQLGLKWEPFLAPIKWFTLGGGYREIREQNAKRAQF